MSRSPTLTSTLNGTVNGCRLCSALRFGFGSRHEHQQWRVLFGALAAARGDQGAHPRPGSLLKNQQATEHQLRMILEA